MSAIVAVTSDHLLRARPASGVLSLTLNRPEVHNAITLAQQRDLDAALTAAATDDDVRVVVLAATGDTAFSAGYDIDEMAGMSADELDVLMIERDALLWRFFTFPKPIVAAVQGMSYGAGTLLAVCSDLRVGGPRTTLAVTAARYGGANLTWILDSLIGSGRAKDMLMTARTVGAREAFEMGLLSRYADAGTVLESALVVAETMATRAPAAMSEIKSLLNDGPGCSASDRYRSECQVSRTVLHPGAPRQVFSQFLERRVE